MKPWFLLLVLLAGCYDIHFSTCLRACTVTSDLCLTSVRECREGCKAERSDEAKQECRTGCDDDAQQCWLDFGDCAADCSEEVEQQL